MSSKPTRQSQLEALIHHRTAINDLIGALENYQALHRKHPPIGGRAGAGCAVDTRRCRFRKPNPR
jgi:hypothetical protein